jgi:signal transduction histidine kinase
MISQEKRPKSGSRKEAQAVPEPGIRCRSLAWPATAGLLFGYVVLHPVSMVVFQWLDPRIAAAAADEAGHLLGPITHSFHVGMLPMGLVFGVIGALIAVFYGRHRLMLTAQRDRLAEQAALLRRQNKELARLELANRRTTQFMAHDFKSALGCITGFAGQLLQQPGLREDTDVGEALVCIRRQAHRIMGSVVDLLEFARVRERGARRMKPVSVTDLLQEVVGDFSLPAHAEQVTVGHNHARCPKISADPRLLRRVLCNLVSNAIKHNGPDTHVWLDGQVDELRTEVLFSCCDDGVGIPPEVLPTIFAEFAGTDDSSGDSTGLGLAFCKAVVEAHDGRIWCESTQQQGAWFFFTVPLLQQGT